MCAMQVYIIYTRLRRAYFKAGFDDDENDDDDDDDDDDSLPEGRFIGFYVTWGLAS